jgi:hypothetical protein
MVAQIRQSDSIRALQADMYLHQNTWYHIGRKGIKRTTLSDRNNKVNPKVFEDTYFHLLRHIKQMLGVQGKEGIYAVDATLITLTLRVFDWATYRKKK